MSADESGATVAEKPVKKKAAKGKPEASKKGAKKAAVKGAKKAETKKEPRRNGELTGNEVKILTVLNKSKKPLTRKDLAEATGIEKGWSKMLGSPTKEGFGVGGEGLEARKLVDSEKKEEGNGFTYVITSKGRDALAKAKE